MRLRRIFAATVLAALVAVPSAMALGFDPYDPNLPDATVGIPYSHQLTARGGCTPYTFTVASGQGLPPGITLTTGGNFTGTPTQAGTWSNYIDLGDNCGFHAQRVFNLTVIPKLTVTTNSLPPAVVGTPYSQQLTFDGGGSVTWSVSQGALPAGIALDTQKGLLSGTPTTVGSSTFTILIKDTGGSRSDTKTLTIDVLAPLAATVTSTPSAEVGVPFKGVTPAATGGKTPYAWSLAAGSSLPAGLALDAATGAITGTPTAAGSFSVVLTVADAYGTKVNVAVPIKIAAKLAVSTLKIRAVKIGKAYQATLHTKGGVEPVIWKVTSGKFPVGIHLDRKAGMIVGKPQHAGVFTFTVTATDKLGVTSEQTLTLTVKANPKKKKK